MKFELKVYPNSKIEALKQIGARSFKVRVKAKPEKGKANQAVINLLADFFELDKDDIVLTKGAKSSKKVIEVKKEIDKVKVAVKVLKQGGIIIYPTDTVYGLGCNALDDKAVRALLKLKKREPGKPLSLAVSDFKMLETIAYLREKDLAKRLLPGPVTLILPKKEVISDLVSAGLPTVGVRMPENNIAISIIKKAGFPIISTSVNESGKEAALDLQRVDLEVDFMVEGSCKYQKPSTVLELETRTIKREGAGLQKVKNLLKI